VPVDLARDPLGPALAAAGHSPDEPTAWVWEGVLPYLRAADAALVAGAVRELSAPGSVLVVQYLTPGLAPAAGRLVARGMSALAHRPSPWHDEPVRSTWSPGALRCLLTGHGFAVRSDTDLLAVATGLGSPTQARTSLRTSRVAVAAC
jgi:O-methyltransferase involved in polyketide biosynthesis